MFKWLLGDKDDKQRQIASSEKKPSAATPQNADRTNPSRPPELSPRKTLIMQRNKATLDLRNDCNFASTPINADEKAFGIEVLRQIKDCETMMAAPDFDLPMLPQASMRLTKLLNEPDVKIKEIGAVIQTDPVLAAKFFKLANSAYYGSRKQIEAIDHAIALLGLSTVKNMVMAIALHGTIFRSKQLEKTAVTFWDHSISTAVAAEVLAREVGLDGSGPGKAYLCGLLHDIGKLPAMIGMQRILGTQPLQIRQEYFTALLEQFHLISGRTLLQFWDLPTEVRVAVCIHHGVNSLDEAKAQIFSVVPDLGIQEMDELTRVMACLVLADRSVASLEIGDEPGPLDIIGSHLALEMGLMDSTLENFLDQLPGRLAKIPSLD